MMAFAIIDTPFSAVNSIEVCKNSIDHTEISIDDLYDSIRVLVRYIISKKKGRLNMKNNWEIKTLGEVCEFRRGLTYSKSDEVSFSRNAVLRANNIDLQSNALNFDEIRYISDDIEIPQSKKLVKNSVMICTASGSKSHLGKVAFVEKDHDYAFGGFMGLLVPNITVVDPKFFFTILTSGQFRDHVDSLTLGANINNLKFSQIQDYEVVIPPLGEQKRIVKILDEKFGAIEELKRVNGQQITDAKELFESKSEDIFESEFESKDFNHTLNDICDLIVDCEHKTAPTQETGFPLVRTPNIGKDSLIFENIKRVSQKTYSEWTKRAMPQPGDLILAREAPAGNVCVIPDGEKVVLGQRTVLIRPNKNVYPYYLSKYLLSKSVQDRLLAKSTGATVLHVNMKDIRTLHIHNFPPFKNQILIAKQLDELSEKTKALEAIFLRKIAYLDELKKSYLEQAFSGKL